MANQWDVAKHVEEHPDDYPQRWRLAKKLYLHWEYRLALEHLQVLRNEWTPKVNVSRFLAATYYRLGRLDEAQSELREAMKRWPTDAGLCLQLARTCEVGGNRAEALEAWATIKKLEPGHPLIEVSIQRLQQALKPPEVVTEYSVSSDAGLDLIPGSACPSCGAQNSAEFDRCWQCHGPLPGLTSSVRRMIESEESEPWSPGGSLRVLTVAAVVLVGMALSLSLWRFLYHPAGEVPSSLQRLFDDTLALTRIGVLLGLIVTWPFIFSLALRGAGYEEAGAFSLGSRMAMSFAGVACLSTFLPGDKLVPLLLFPALVSLFCCLGFLPGSKVRALGVWAFQYGLAALAGVIFFILLEWGQTRVLFNPFTETPALQAYAREAAVSQERGSAEAEGSCPLSLRVRANSTGSPWLDAHAGQSVLGVECGTEASGYMVELAENSSTVLYEPMNGASWKKAYPLKSGMEYTFVLTGPATGHSRIELRSLLNLERLPDSEKTESATSSAVPAPAAPK